MRKQMLVAGSATAVLIAGGVWGGVAAATGAGTSAPAPTSAEQTATGGGPERLVMFFRERSLKFIDVGKPDFSDGDYVVGAGVFETRSGRKLAVRGGQCTSTSMKVGTGQCLSAIRFVNGGRLMTAEAQVGSGPINRGVIIGGTGEFRGAQGSYWYDTRDTGERGRTVFLLLLP